MNDEYSAWLEPDEGWNRLQDLKNQSTLQRAVEQVAFWLSCDVMEQAKQWQAFVDALRESVAIRYYWGYDEAWPHLHLGVEAANVAAILELNGFLQSDKDLGNRFKRELVAVPKIFIKEIVRLSVPRQFCHGSEVWHYSKQPNIHHCPVCFNRRPSTKYDRGEEFSQKYRRSPNRSKRERVMKRYQYLCVKCASHDDLEMGHCISVADGRDNAVDPDLLHFDENYAPMCRACNAKQGARSLTPEEYLSLAVPQAVVAIYRTLKDIHGAA
jgi:5-methylcytosine-specific restriction endonuclease McrA